MARASSGSKVSSPFGISTRGSSRGIMLVPLDLWLLSLGLERRSGGFDMLCSDSIDDMELELLAGDEDEASGFDAGTVEGGTTSDINIATNFCFVGVNYNCELASGCRTYRTGHLEGGLSGGWVGRDQL